MQLMDGPHQEQAALLSRRGSGPDHTAPEQYINRGGKMVKVSENEVMHQVHHSEKIHTDTDYSI